ncbi:hypothetical protein COT78_00105 [Candidatus Berkelbacteria bacterium CG10_big_fil_rev_8_21_14_0_10_43_13]|uniref:Uncharacterized protein n=1 Tax=Candidatus Berkelbacteria bacterium CG10_big_fil_rev_8_21_14_0_10_43_13 TaxID=1974514 RepID=A0A2H0W7N3_9BACT|nr:MAG: hypothetical protein COT78_00105 [Candidatus Berkelbacteria bacterium CG10_big_fil_rev_8_21_14_0_10_43_13]
MGIVQKALADLTLNISKTAVTNQSTLVDLAVLWVGSIAGVIAFFFLMYGGFMYLTAAGNPDQSKKGMQSITNAIIGLIIIALAYGLTSWILSAVNKVS